VVSHFYGTIAIAMLVLSANWKLILELNEPAYVLWLVGVAMTIAFSLLIPYVMFTQAK